MDMTASVIPAWTLGDRIRKARATVSMDQRAFADALGVKAGTLAGWESDNSRPRDLVDIARKIENLTDIPASWLLGIDPQEHRSPRRIAESGGGVMAITREYPHGKSPRPNLRNSRSTPRSASLLHRRSSDS